MQSKISRARQCRAHRKNGQTNPTRQNRLISHGFLAAILIRRTPTAEARASALYWVQPAEGRPQDVLHFAGPKVNIGNAVRSTPPPNSSALRTVKPVMVVTENDWMFFPDT